MCGMCYTCGMGAESPPQAVPPRRELVRIVGRHPWASYTGEVVGRWPATEYDWLIHLDNGLYIGALDQDVEVIA